MIVLRVESPDIDYSRFVAEQYVPIMRNIFGIPEDALQIVAMPSRVEDETGVAEIYMESTDSSDLIPNQGFLIRMEPFALENSPYDLLLHENELLQ